MSSSCFRSEHERINSSVVASPIDDAAAVDALFALPVAAPQPPTQQSAHKKSASARAADISTSSAAALLVSPAATPAPSADAVARFLRALFFTPAAVDRVFAPLAPLLAAPLPECRRRATDIMHAFPPLHFTANRERDSQMSGACNFVELCHRLAHTRVELAQERAITLLLRGLVQMAASKRLPAPYARALPYVSFWTSFL